MGPAHAHHAKGTRANWKHLDLIRPCDLLYNILYSTRLRWFQWLHLNTGSRSLKRERVVRTTRRHVRVVRAPEPTESFPARGMARCRNLSRVSPDVAFVNRALIPLQSGRFRTESESRSSRSDSVSVHVLSPLRILNSVRISLAAVTDTPSGRILISERIHPVRDRATPSPVRGVRPVAAAATRPTPGRRPGRACSGSVPWGTWPARRTSTASTTRPRTAPHAR